MEKKITKTFSKIWLPTLISLLIIGLHIIYVSTNSRLGMTGIYPREVDGLIGIIFTPLMHSDWRHVFANVLPFFGLSLMLFMLYERISVIGLVLIYILTGFVVWLFARPVYHIGASGVVYGLVSFIFFNGLFRRDRGSIILALIVTFMYMGSGYFLGILPNQKGISWESHLFGAFVGVFVSFVLKDIKEENYEKPALVDDGPVRAFLPRDTFEKKKWERNSDAEN